MAWPKVPTLSVFFALAFCIPVFVSAQTDPPTTDILPKLIKASEVRRTSLVDVTHALGFGVNYLGGQVRYLFSPAWACEVRYATGQASSTLGAVSSRVFGLRGYRFYGGSQRDLQLVLGAEADYLMAGQKSTNYGTSGTAIGGFLGMEYHLTHRFSLGINIGPYLISLREKTSHDSSSSLEFVADSYINFYAF